MLNVSPEHLALLRAILAEYLPQGEVRAFGSRVSGNVKAYSDLDLVLKLPQAVDIRTMGRLREALQVSLLPFRVDLVDWNQTSDSFKKIIAQNNELVWPVV